MKNYEEVDEEATSSRPTMKKKGLGWRLGLEAWVGLEREKDGKGTKETAQLEYTVYSIQYTGG